MVFVWLRCVVGCGSGALYGRVVASVLVRLSGGWTGLVVCGGGSADLTGA